MRRIETAAIAFAIAALAAGGALLAQDNPAPAPAPAAPPAASAPPASAPPAQAPAPTAPSAEIDDEFIPTEELNADDQVTFPVDI